MLGLLVLAVVAVLGLLVLAAVMVLGLLVLAAVVLTVVVLTLAPPLALPLENAAPFASFAAGRAAFAAYVRHLVDAAASAPARQILSAILVVSQIQHCERLL